MMTEFKVGDAVRLTGRTWRDDFGPHMQEKDFTVEGFGESGLADDLGVLPYVTHYSFGRLYIFQQGDDDYSASLIPEATGNPVSPNHYQFPGGIEVRQISAHLTSFGGQTLQYVARATRLDGKNKGNVVEDLEKAKTLIDWEITRVKGANE